MIVSRLHAVYCVQENPYRDGLEDAGEAVAHLEVAGDDYELGFGLGELAQLLALAGRREDARTSMLNAAAVARGRYPEIMLDVIATGGLIAAASDDAEGAGVLLGVRARLMGNHGLVDQSQERHVIDEVERMVVDGGEVEFRAGEERGAAMDEDEVAVVIETLRALATPKSI